MHRRLLGPKAKIFGAYWRLLITLISTNLGTTIELLFSKVKSNVACQLSSYYAMCIMVWLRDYISDITLFKALLRHCMKHAKQGTAAASTIQFMLFITYLVPLGKPRQLSFDKLPVDKNRRQPVLCLTPKEHGNWRQPYMRIWHWLNYALA